MAKKKTKNFSLDDVNLQHVLDVAYKMQSSDSYALRQIILEHMMMEGAARAKNVAQQLPTHNSQRPGWNRGEAKESGIPIEA